MHRLGRQVRFSVNPFRAEAGAGGSNPFCSAPCGEGLAVYLELGVELTGPVLPETGFVINVVDIDQTVRRLGTPVFVEAVQEAFGKAQHIGLCRLAEILKRAWANLEGQFGRARLSSLILSLNPNRKITMDSPKAATVQFSEKFEYAAMHRLWNDRFSPEKNFEVFGKCANPSGHGHNYMIEVTVEKLADDASFSIAGFEEAVQTHLINLVDHKNLNADVPEFGSLNPTVENIAVFAWGRLVGKFQSATLRCVTVWESQRTYCSYRGSDGFHSGAIRHDE